MAFLGMSGSPRVTRVGVQEKDASRGNESSVTAGACPNGGAGTGRDRLLDDTGK